MLRGQCSGLPDFPQFHFVIFIQSDLLVIAYAKKIPVYNTGATERVPVVQLIHSLPQAQEEVYGGIHQPSG